MRRTPWLVFGFGGLLLLMAGAETGAFLFLSSLRNTQTSLESKFLNRSRLLDSIRSHIYLSGTYVRDSLLAPAPSDAQAQVNAIESLRRDTDKRLTEYARDLEPEQVEPFQALRSEIDAYWQVLDRTFQWTAVEREKYRSAFFYEELVPRRTSMLQIADRVGAMNEQDLNRGSSQLNAQFGRLQLGLMAILVATLIGGTALAAFTIGHLWKLDAEARQRLDESVQAKKSLEELSAKLVRMQEEERRALSRELHDEVGQSFSAILMESENLIDLHLPGNTTSHLTAIRTLAEKGIEEIQNMALLLRPSMLDDFGLVPALNWQARETAKRTGLRIQVNAGEVAENLPEEHKTCIYRVVQEALTNCSRHAQARTVLVRVRTEAEKIFLDVQDDGAGFDPVRVRGLGLLGMEERVRHLGGTFDIESRPGRGTILIVQLPLATLNGESSNGYHTDSNSSGR